MYVSPMVGVDTTTGTFRRVFVDAESAYGGVRAELNFDASPEHGIYEGLHVTITAGKEEGEMVSFFKT